MGERLTVFIGRWYKILVVICVLAVAVLAYYIGFIEGKEGAQSRVALLCDKDVLSTLAIPLGAVANATQKTDASIATKSTTTQDNTVSSQSGGPYMGSKNGKKYYTTGCSGAKRIKPANTIYFKDAQDAQLQGYTRGSC